MADPLHHFITQHTDRAMPRIYSYEVGSETMYCPTTPAALGTDLALLLRQLHYWLTRKQGGVMRDGYRWVYKSYADWQSELFPYSHERTLQRLVATGRAIGVLLTARKIRYPLLYRLDYAVIASEIEGAGLACPFWVSQGLEDQDTEPDAVQLDMAAEADLTQAVSEATEVSASEATVQFRSEARDRSVVFNHTEITNRDYQTDIS